ncbi:hypothetical protein LWF15_20175 [Kineosporia rhizophila]|uniref:hypothetical protein n=1 Tax=Kineosporia rhizophila TaxID=84633 RepID=UPI000B2F339F|nr:hypothetical protein [Kineosporia rhizophila]MCE0537814.1 hypothetical protein [Kineosporia rhizophila]
MKRTGTTLFVGLGLIATTLVAGCGAEQTGKAGTTVGSGPKAELLRAFQNLGDTQELGVQARLESSRADLVKINAAQPKTERMSKEDIDLAVAALDGRISSNFSAAEDKTLSDGPDSYQVSVQLKDSSLVDVVGVDDQFYLRVDADWWTDQFGTNVAEARTVFDDVPPVFADPGNALLDSRWISINLPEAEQALTKDGLLEDLTEIGAPDPTRGYDLLNSLKTAFEKDVKVTTIDGGYRMTAPAKQIAESVQDDLAALTGDTEIASIDEMPDQDVAVDLYVDNGKLTGLNVDLVQFLEKPVKGANLALDVEIDQQAEPVQAPADATVADVPAIIAYFSS